MAGWRLLPDAVDFDDLVQTVIVQILSTQGPSGDQLSVAAATENSDVVSIAFRKAADCLGGKEAKRRQRGGPQVESLVSDPVSTDESGAIDLMMDMTEILASWSPRERGIWTDSFEGLTVTEIGERHRLSPQSVYAILARVKQRLAVALKE